MCIKHDMNFIAEYLINQDADNVNNTVLKRVVEKHSLPLFKLCLPLIEKITPDVLWIAIKEEQIDMVVDILKTGVDISTECVTAACVSDEPIQILTLINIYGNVTNVDYNSVLTTVKSIDIIKLFAHHITSETIVNKAIHDDELELFTTFVKDMNPNQLTGVITACIKSGRLEMLQHVFDETNDDMFNHIFLGAARGGSVDILKWIVTYDNPIYTETWDALCLNLENLCDQDVLPHVLERYKTSGNGNLLLNAVSKNDTWCVDYIVNNLNPHIWNFTDVVFKQVLFHKNVHVLQSLLKLKRTNDGGIDDLLSIVKSGGEYAEIEGLLSQIDTKPTLPIWGNGFNG